MDMAKEALFNVLSHRYDFPNCNVLDLFGGTGAISLEFVSRGCSDVCWVDKHPGCLAFVSAVADELDIRKSLKVYRSDALAFLRNTPDKYDIIFADPPYDYPQYEKIASLVFERSLLRPEGFLILEHESDQDFQQLPGFSFFKCYGRSCFSFFE